MLKSTIIVSISFEMLQLFGPLHVAVPRTKLKHSSAHSRHSHHLSRTFSGSDTTHFQTQYWSIAQMFLSHLNPSSASISELAISSMQSIDFNGSFVSLIPMRSDKISLPSGK